MHSTTASERRPGRLRTATSSGNGDILVAAAAGGGFVRRVALSASFLLGTSLCACSGGTSTAGSTVPVPGLPTPTQTPTPPVTGLPASATQSVKLGPASTVTFATIASGVSGSIAFPAASSGQGATTVTLQATLPAGVPIPQTVQQRAGTTLARSPAALGAGVTPLLYIVVTPSSPLIFRATPALRFTIPAGKLAGYAYLAFFDPANPKLGWNAIAGPVPASGTNVDLPSQLDDSPPLALGAKNAYVFALVVNGTVLPTPSPAPGSITEFPVPGGAEAGLNNGITTGPDGNIWFTESDADKIDKITTAGAITQYPLPALIHAGPQGIAVGPDGNLWFAEYESSAIGKITTNGAVTEYPLPQAGRGPVNIAAGADGNLWFTEYLNSAIGKITPNGVVTEYPLAIKGSDFAPGPFGIAAGRDGNLWFTENSDASNGGNGIGKITTGGTIAVYPLQSEYSGPIGITPGPDGNMWFVENGNQRVGKITPGGTISEYPLGTTTSLLQEIVAGPDGNFWLSDLQNRIYSFSPSGAVQKHLVPTPDSQPNGITVGPDGNIWFTEQAGQIGRLFIR